MLLQQILRAGGGGRGAPGGEGGVRGEQGGGAQGRGGGRALPGLCQVHRCTNSIWQKHFLVGEKKCNEKIKLVNKLSLIFVKPSF